MAEIPGPVTWQAFATRLKCVNMTPFGAPVVPELYGIAATSLWGSNFVSSSEVLYNEPSSSFIIDKNDLHPSWSCSAIIIMSLTVLQHISC